MANAVEKNTDVEAPMKELAKKRKVFGYTSNKYGRIILVTQEAYDNMIKNNDTLRDKNGLNDVFANVSDKELKAIEKLAKSKVKAPVWTPREEIKEIEAELTKERAKLKKEAEKIIVSRVSQLRNFMVKFLAEEIDEEKTGLSDAVIKELMKVQSTSEVVDNSAELDEANAEIERLKAQLKAGKTAKAPAKKVTKSKTEAPAEVVPEETEKTEAPKEDTPEAPADAGTDEDDPFDK